MAYTYNQRKEIREVRDAIQKQIGSEIYFDLTSKLRNLFKEPHHGNFPLHFGDFVFESGYCEEVTHYKEVVSGYYKKNGLHFTFTVRSNVFSAGQKVKEFLAFSLISNSPTELKKKDCTCPWNLLHKGCKCGAITPYKPQY